MKIFITGGSGFVGNAVIKQLQGKHQFIALSRSEKSDKAIAVLGATPVRGALGHITPTLLKNCDVVIHAAARVEQFGTLQQFWQTNVLGTRQLLEVAKKSGIKRFIHIGTEASVFYGQNMINIDEQTPLAFDSPYFYSKTKAWAEDAVIKANDAEHHFLTLSIRPRMIWGPDDKTILPVVLDMVKKRKFIWLNGGQNKTVTTNIHNLLHAIELALTKGLGGQAYFVTDNEVMTIRCFLTQLIQSQNVDVPTKSAPGRLISFIASTTEYLWKIARLKSDPPLSRFAIDITQKECTINIDKAKRELGYQPIISVSEGFQELHRD